MSLTRVFLATSLLTAMLPLAAAAQTAIIPATAPAAPAISVTPATTPAPSNAAMPVTRGELPEQVRQIILDNPDIIMEAAKKMHDKQIADSKKESEQGLEKHKADLFNDTISPRVGPKDADVTLVEFFDYHCGYCKQLLPSIVKLTQEDKKIRVIFREFPILSEDSVTASRAALAVYTIAPEKYFDFHIALMKNPGRFDETAITDIAKKQGINTDKLKAEMAKPSITAELDANRALAEDLGIRGTPGIVFHDQLVPGALPYDELKKMVEDERHGVKPDDSVAGPQS